MAATAMGSDIEQVLASSDYGWILTGNNFRIGRIVGLLGMDENEDYDACNDNA
jgi:hypothetical protein